MRRSLPPDWQDDEADEATQPRIWLRSRAHEEAEEAAPVAPEEEEDEEEQWVEPFSLLENVVAERFRDATATAPTSSVEVIRYEGKAIADLLRADAGGEVRVGADGFRLVELRDDGRAVL